VLSTLVAAVPVVVLLGLGVALAIALLAYRMPVRPALASAGECCTPFSAPCSAGWAEPSPAQIPRRTSSSAACSASPPSRPASARSSWARANSLGGLMGKMVDAQNIVVASTETNWHGHEGALLRYVFFHSLALAVLVGILVFCHAYLYPFTRMVVP